MKIIREKRTDIPGILFRFVSISEIQNNTMRRFALIATAPVFFSFNCIAIIPTIAVTFLYNNIALFRTIGRCWNQPIEKKGIKT